MLARIDTFKIDPNTKLSFHQRTDGKSFKDEQAMRKYVAKLNEEAVDGYYYKGFAPGTHWRK